MTNTIKLFPKFLGLLALSSSLALGDLVEIKDKMIEVTADGFPAMKANSSAVYRTSDDKQHRIGSMNDAGETKVETVKTPGGEAEATTITYSNGDDPVKYSVTIKKLKGMNAFTLQGFLVNTSEEDIKFPSCDLFAPVEEIAFKSPADWLVTPLMHDKHAHNFAETEDSFKEVAIITHKDGRNLLVGAVGPAEAHIRVEVRKQHLKSWVSMESVLVPAGTTRRTEEVIFCFEPTEKAIKAWTSWVSATHGERLNKGPVYGWCSWYDRTTKIDEEHVRNVTKIINENKNTFGQGVIQIDDGYQKMDGDWSANEKFPSGMADVAKTIRETGNKPGVWFAPLMIHPDHPWAKENPEAIQKNAKGIASFMNANPFHPAGANWINPDHPKSKEFLFNIIRDAKERGYQYIKIDFNGIGNNFVDKTKTSLQVFRELYTLYREAAGEDMYILSCLGEPTRGVIGFIDSARVGPDSHPAHFPKCLQSVQRFQIYDNVWWQNDPDVSYLAPKLESRVVGFTPQGEGCWRTWHGITGLVGGTAMISEPIDKDDAKAVWRNYEIMRPGSAEPAKLYTLGQSPNNEIFGFEAERSYGDFSVFNVYNVQEESREINLNFQDFDGIPNDQECKVYDFWENKVISTTKGSYNTVNLPQYSSALIRITPIESGKPALVGSNLHLSIGATEIADFSASDAGIDIKLTDAGAQNGDLTVYSEKALKAGESENCFIAGVESLGENLYKVSLKDRLWNTEQKVSLLY